MDPVIAWSIAAVIIVLWLIAAAFKIAEIIDINKWLKRAEEIRKGFAKKVP